MTTMDKRFDPSAAVSFTSARLSGKSGFLGFSSPTFACCSFDNWFQSTKVSLFLSFSLKYCNQLEINNSRKNCRKI